MSDREHEERAGGGQGPGISEEPESEEGVDSQAEDDHIRWKDAKRMELRRNHEDHFRSVSSSKHNHHHHHKSRLVPFFGFGSVGAQRYAAVGNSGGGMTVQPSPSSYRHHHEGRSNGGSGSQNRVVRPWDQELDAEGDYYLNDDRFPPPRPLNRSIPILPWPIGLADLDSPSGR